MYTLIDAGCARVEEELGVAFIVFVQRQFLALKILELPQNVYQYSKM